jgi:hypothetical protein
MVIKFIDIPIHIEIAKALSLLIRKILLSRPLVMERIAMLPKRLCFTNKMAICTRKNIGIQDNPLSIFYEGEALSKALNIVPAGINAVG